MHSLRLLCALLALTLAASQKARHHEQRAIVRYAQGGTLQERVKKLEAIPGVKKAEALSRLDMAVVAFDDKRDEDAVLQAIDAQEGVELAVPDTWLQAYGNSGQAEAGGAADKRACSANPTCTAWGLSGSCCPTNDGVRLACCEADGGRLALDTTTISLKSFHGGYVMAHHEGHVGLYGDMEHADTHFVVEAHSDGYVSLKSQHGTYLIAAPSGRVATWHRDHGEADEWEKFKIIYNQDGTISLRSKASDKHVAAEHPRWGVLSADREVISDWEKFQVNVTHGEDSRVPGDAKFEKLWGMDHFGDRDIDAVEAWKMFTGKSAEGLVVAVIDTGIDYTHPDLKDQMWVNPNEIPGNGIDDDDNGIIDDVHGADFANNDGDPMDDQMHGTHCSGTIAGRGDNGLGVAGVAWQGVRLMALKFLSGEGGGRTSDAVKAVNYAVAMGARLSSNSWGGGGSSSALRVAIERAEKAGMLFVAAAGNEGANNDEVPSYPANYPSSNVISVASTTVKGELSSFSCYGGSTVDVAAPGSDIYSSIPGGKYKSLSGTSMATPHVSGLAALVWLYRPQLSMLQVKEIIMKSTVKEKALKKTSLTEGRINARRALELASSYTAPQAPAHAPKKLTFKDHDSQVGKIGGVARITAADEESDVDYYSLHFLSTAGFLMDSVGRVNATGHKHLKIRFNNVTIPRYATGWALVAANADAKADASTAAVAELEDYGVPEAGPGAVSWGGDADPRAGYVAGAIKVHRATNERTVTHYNIYWRNSAQRGELVGTVPAVGFSEPSCSGDCGLLNSSHSSSGSFHFHRGQYGNDEFMSISFSGPATVKITSFMTERYYDYLDVAGTDVTGTGLPLPMVIDVPAGPQSITWASDSSETSGGWSFELSQAGGDAIFDLPTMQPPSMDVEVFAAYGETELAKGASGSLSDFDAATMPPSAVFAPRSLRFFDTDAAQHYVAGHVEVEIPPPAGIVTFYRIFFADADGDQVGSASWTVEVPSGATSEMTLEVDVPHMELPPAAALVVARPGSERGESQASTSVALVDVVHSVPMGANFSGDEDPRENEIKGDLTIQPAEIATGIVAYAVYLTNGTQKEHLLGKVPPAGDDAVDFRVKIHAREYEPGQGLLVVSVYNDMEMDEGAYVELEDAVNSDAPAKGDDDGNPFAGGSDYGYDGFGYGGYGSGRRLQEAGQEPALGSLDHDSDYGYGPQEQAKPLEPWLNKRYQPAWNEVHELWSVEHPQRAAALQLLKSGSVRGEEGRRKLLGSLTVPGLPRSLGSEEAAFAPPSEGERSALAAGLAAVLPGVGREQIRLLTGKALTGAAAKAGAVQATGAGRRLSPSMKQALDSNLASLVVNFEIVPAPEVAADADAEQTFLDRVEARLILLSRGGSAASRLSSAASSLLQSAGAALPEGGIHILVGEPQQVAPKQRPNLGRELAEERRASAEMVLDDSSDDDSHVVAGTAMAAALAAICGAVGSVGCAAVLTTRSRRRSSKEAGTNSGVAEVALEGVSVHIFTETDE